MAQAIHSLPHPKQARFWAFINGSPVRIKLDPGDEFEHREGGATDEGYSVTYTSWRYDGAFVERHEYIDARDCDGRITHEYHGQCRRDYLDSGSRFEGINYPDWQDIGHSQRDYSAEAMGY